MTDQTATLDRDVLLPLAVGHHQAGRLGEASALYELVLRSQPANHDALHLLGLVRIAQGAVEDGIGLIRQAIALNPVFPLAHANLGTELLRLGRWAEAAESFEHALVARPDDLALLTDRGAAHFAAGHYATALETYDRMLALRPEDPMALASRGLTTRALGRFEAAVADFERAMALAPDHPFAAAELGLTWQMMRQFAQAVPCYDAALALRPDNATVLARRGNVLWELDRLDAALADLDRAVARAPDWAEPWNDRGNVLQDLQRYPEALACYDRALALHPSYQTARMNRGAVLQRVHRYDDALADYAAVLAAAADHADARFNQGQCRLAMGDYARGWPGYEFRWRRSFDHLPQPEWRGETDIAGQRLLLTAEQGFGDTIQFCRFVADVASRGAVPILAVQPGLRTWLADVPGAAQVLSMDDGAPDFDLHCPLMSLPALLGLRAVPPFRPYLHADPAAVSVWRARLAEYPGLKVGLAWAGDPRTFDRMATRMDRRRSMRLAWLAPLASVPGVTFVSLQKGEAVVEGFPGLVDWTAALTDFAATAALVAALDLVISVDTAVVHVAGALNVPVWVLSRYDRCWRWMWGRTDTPWYPSVRLFTQAAPGEWGPVVEAVRGELAGMAGRELPGGLCCLVA